MLVVFSMASGAILIAVMESRAVFELTRSIDIDNQRYNLELSLQNVVQESLLSFMEQNLVNEEAASISLSIERMLEPLNRAKGLELSIIQIPDFPTKAISLSGALQTEPLVFIESLGHKNLGFSFEQYLEAGPYVYLGSETFEFEYELNSLKRKASVKIATHSVAIPITNFECIEYSLGFPETPVVQENTLDFMGDRLLSFPSLHQENGQTNSLPYQFRYLASVTHNLFHAIWSNQFKDEFLRLAYNDGYFSRESWPVKQFDGMSYDEKTDTVKINLAEFKGERLAIVDKTGALKLRIYGDNTESRPLALYVISYAQEKTSVFVEQLENQMLVGYFSNCQVHLKSYRGALFASPETELVSEYAEIKGSLFYDKNSSFLRNCRKLKLHGDQECKLMLKERSPKVILSKAKVLPH